MWWAVVLRHDANRRPSKTVGARLCLNPNGPTQMAIPLQMDVFPEQLVAATRARTKDFPTYAF